MFARRVRRHFTRTARSRRSDSSPTASILSPASLPRAESDSSAHRSPLGCRTTVPPPLSRFLLDGPHPSENLLLHQSLDTQASRDFFERAPTNHTLAPTTFPNTLMLPLLRFWLSPDIESDRNATAGSFGGRHERWHRRRACAAPELVYLYGADEVHNDPASTDDFRSILAEIPSGSLLYRMYGKASRRRQARSISVPSLPSLGSSRRNSGTASWPSGTPGARSLRRHDTKLEEISSTPGASAKDFRDQRLTTKLARMPSP